jgi:hypothetical protein
VTRKLSVLRALPFPDNSLLAITARGQLTVDLRGATSAPPCATLPRCLTCLLPRAGLARDARCSRTSQGPALTSTEYPLYVPRSQVLRQPLHRDRHAR